MISFGIATLPTSCSSAPNSAAQARLVVDAELVGDRDGELDHVLGVLAGVGVVGLDHVAEQQRGAAVGAGQLDRLLDARGALAGEDREQPGERDHEEHGVRLVGGGEGRQQADREEQGVDAVGHRELAEDGAGILAQAGPHARDVDHAVERDHGDQRGHVHGPVAPVRRLGAADDEHRRGASANQASATESRARSRATRPRSASISVVMIRASATSSGTVGVGSSSSIGTRITCVGTANPAPAGNSARATSA